MDLSKIMAISGKPGLYRIVSQSKGGLIVESLTDGKKMPVFASNRSSVLEDISMFTDTEDIPLKKVLWNIFQKEDGKEVSIDSKADGNVLFEYFESILPNFDKDRVYPSDIKKAIAWYNQLLQHDLISEPKDEEETLEEEEKQPEKTPDKKKAEEKPALTHKAPPATKAAPRAEGAKKAPTIRKTKKG